MLVAGLCDGLMMAAPGHPVQEVFRASGWWCEDERPDRTSSGQVNGTRQTGPEGPVVVVAVVVRARTADATRQNSDQRIQEFQQVTCPSSRPVKLLPSWKVSSIRHRRQITSTSWARVTGAGDQQRKKEISPVYRCRRATRTLVPSSGCPSGVSSARTPSQAESYPRCPSFRVRSACASTGAAAPC